MTDVQTRPSAITVDDLMRLDEDRWIEVVDGELVETDMAAAGYLHIIVIENLYDLLKPFVKAKRLGRVHGDGLTYILATDEKGVHRTRIPDFSFIRRERIPKNFDWENPFPGAPDLAVEVVSPTEGATTVLEKVHHYLEAGTEQVWVVYPRQRQIYQYLPGGGGTETVNIYGEEDTIEASLLFPDFKLKVADLFVIEAV